MVMRNRPENLVSQPVVADIRQRKSRFRGRPRQENVPQRDALRLVKVQWDELHVRILHPNTSQLFREHLHQKRGGYRIQEEDHPKKMPLSIAQLLRPAEHAGAAIGKSAS